jgi:Domain of unknown function (DUF4419)
MGMVMQEHVFDSEFREWIMPAFSTTMDTDRVVASIIMTAQLQRYFTYQFNPPDCGLPPVTLLGEKADWEMVRLRIEKLRTFGDEPTT